MCRLHHCIADGMALVFVLLSLTDMMPGAPPPTGNGAEEDEAEKTTIAVPSMRWCSKGLKAVGTVWQTTSKVASEGLGSIGESSPCYGISAQRDGYSICRRPTLPPLA